MSPEEIAELMTDDISVNNGIIEELPSPKELKKPWEREITSISEDMAMLRARYKFLTESTESHNETPTRIPILPHESYIQPIRPPKPTPPAPKPISKVGHTKRVIIL